MNFTNIGCVWRGALVAGGVQRKCGPIDPT